MGGKRGAMIALGAAVAAIAGCGGGARMATVTQANDSAATAPVPMPTRAMAPDDHGSDRYCQRLDDGAWVTNDSPYSTTPCVPDPSNATGDEQADSSLALPRCFSCSLADWKRAEARARASSVGDDSGDTTGGGAAQVAWGAAVRARFVALCAGDHEDPDNVCECVADQVATQVPAAQADTLSSDDRRVQAAARRCTS